MLFKEILSKVKVCIGSYLLFGQCLHLLYLVINLNVHSSVTFTDLRKYET